jgi:DNA-binding NarL/FixJ family response regulator
METRGVASTALIVAGPGSLRESLRAMLISMQPDLVILEADDAAAAEALLREYHPDFVLIDGDLPDRRAVRLVEATQAEKPRARCSILVDNVRQQAAAMKAGADHAAFKGDPPPRLFSQVERLLTAG